MNISIYDNTYYKIKLWYEWSFTYPKQTILQPKSDTFFQVNLYGDFWGQWTLSCRSELSSFSQCSWAKFDRRFFFLGCQEALATKMQEPGAGWFFRFLKDFSKAGVLQLPISKEQRQCLDAILSMFGVICRKNCRCVSVGSKVVTFVERKG